MEALTANDPAQVGPYRLEGVLGAGGMGVVYLGRAADGAQAAVKVVHSHLATDAGFRRRFVREFAVARSVTGPWFAALLDGDADAQPPWFATEYIASPTLVRVVEGDGPLPEPAVATLAHRLADALSHLHAQGVVHRDLKPSNVLVADDGPRLIDFGVARAIDATALTQTGMVIGTPSFMSPEQAAAAEVGPASDVFSLASTLVYAATGTGPFGHTTNGLAMLRRISDDEPDLTGLTAELRAVLTPCFAKDPAMRPSAAELAARLDTGRPPAAGWSPLHEWDPAAIGPYRLIGRLGAGGMGQVYLARASSAGDEGGTPPVAVKVVHEQYAADRRFRERFAREIATARAVRSHRVVELIDSDPDARIPWLATEYVAGPSLEQAVTDSGALPEPAALDLAAGLAEALSALHDRGVVHRDLKPSNVLLAEDGPKLIDFGIARAFDETALTHTGGVLGAPGFMSPEQAAGEDVGPPSDVFSFASVIVFAATGRGPFGTTGSPLALLRRVIDDPPDTTGVPQRLLQAIQPCFARNPGDRPTAPEMLSRLMALATAPGTLLLPPPTAVQPEPPSRPRRISRRAVLIGGTAAAGLAVAGTAGWIAVRAANQPPPVRAPRWSVPGPGIRGTADTAPRVIAGDPLDRLFVAARDRVVALDPATGATTWTYQARTHSQSIHIGDGFGANTLGCYVTDGFDLTALDLDNGAEKWSKRVATLVHASDTATLCRLFSDNGHGAITALFPTDGSVHWSRAGDTREVISSVISTRDYIHLDGESRILTLDTSGRQLWEQPTPSHPSWVASRAGLFVASDKKVEALSSRTGTTMWSKAVSPEGASSTPALTCNDHSVYFADAKALEAWDAATGERRWRVEQPDDDANGATDGRWHFWGAPVCTADHVIVTERGWSTAAPDRFRVSVRSTHDGTTLWTTPLPDGHDDVGYTVGTGQVYVTSAPLSHGGTPTIHAMSLRDTTS